MIAVDTNLLVYAHREDSPFHTQALACINALAEKRSAWAIPWPCLHEFYAIATHPRIYRPPSSQAQALAQIDAWLEAPNLILLTESARHWQTLRSLLVNGQIHGPMVHDSRIAALCLQHGAEVLWTADRDFSRFPGLNAHNPLVE